MNADYTNAYSFSVFDSVILKRAAPLTTTFKGIPLAHASRHMARNRPRNRPRKPDMARSSIKRTKTWPGLEKQKRSTSMAGHLVEIWVLKIRWLLSLLSGLCQDLRCRRALSAWESGSLLLGNWWQAMAFS